MTALPHEKRFHFRDGSNVSTLDELYTHLKTAGNSEFEHHVYQGNNDFANWIAYVLHKEKLADSLQLIDKKEEMLSIIKQDLHSSEQKKRKTSFTQSPKRKLIGFFDKDFAAGLITGMSFAYIIFSILL
tara:strand:+ start:328 stop:714 length:387 start_codon:yes stop_codon:yes gene_type:complete